MTRKVYLDNDTFDICKLTFDCKFLKQIFKKFLLYMILQLCLTVHIFIVYKVELIDMTVLINMGKSHGKLSLGFSQNINTIFKKKKLLNSLKEELLFV